MTHWKQVNFYRKVFRNNLENMISTRNSILDMSLIFFIEDSEKCIATTIGNSIISHA